MLRSLDLTDEDKAAIRYLSFLTLKPTMYIANVNEDGFENNPYLGQGSRNRRERRFGRGSGVCRRRS